MELSAIYEPIQEDLDRVEERLSQVSKVDSTCLEELLAYSLGGGKKIRPVLTLLVGKFFNYNLDCLIPMAAAVQLMHTSTLVHDDAIDKADVRWGRPTINKVWGEEKAILLGDYLFAEAGVITASTQNLRVVTLFAETLKIISGGQLDEISLAFNLEQTFDQYLQRISSKTAALFSMATESGAILSEAPEDAIQVLIEYGYNFGIAFQIIDDVFDFISNEDELGKPVGSDLAQGTLTLPAMLLLERYPNDNPVRIFFEDRSRQEKIPLAIDMVCNSSIVQDCYTTASKYVEDACRNLSQLPDNTTRQSLVDLADYVIKRRR